MQEVECFKIRELHDTFNIPAVQRGLVWDATRICNLWDSIAKGYPIGSFIAYKNENGLQLLDGQQRLNSLLIAFGKNANNNDADSRLWVKFKSNEDNAALGFMVCTPNNPWGFKENGDRFDASTRAEANLRFLNVGNNSEHDRFQIASVENAFPWEGFSDGHSDYVPMDLLCMEPNFDKYKHYMEECNYKVVSKEIFDKLAERVQDLIDTKIPIIISQRCPSNVIELFQRINKGGERLSGPDEIYSVICVYCGEDIKSENNSISRNLMPPERLIQLALRMAKTIGDKQFCATYIDVETVKRWFSRGDKYVEHLRGLYKKDDGGASCLGRLVEQTKELLFKDNDPLPISIFLNARYCWENWMLVLLQLLQKFRVDYFKAKENQRYLKLLALLPYITIGTTVKEKTDRVFCETFYNAVCGLPEETPLIELIAIGLSCVMLKPETFVFPWPGSPDDKDIDRVIQGWVSNDMAYLDKWALCILKYVGTQENPLLFYYQREYVNKIIEGTRFNPAFRCATDIRNRPWDMDHIFPDANWQNDDDIRNLAGNMQVMFFSDNRSKGNRYNGYSDETKEGKKWFRYDCSVVHEEDVDWQGFVKSRLSDIIKDMYDTLYINELRGKINKLYCEDYETKDTWPDELKKAIERYRYFSEVSRSNNLSFACLQYSWKQQSKNVQMSDVAVLKIRDDDFINFYESLTKSLALYPRGTSNGNALAQIWGIIEGNNVDYEVGIGRPFGMGREEWRKNNKNNDNWWNDEEPKSCKRCDIEDNLKTMLANMT